MLVEVHDVKRAPVHRGGLAGVVCELPCDRSTSVCVCCRDPPRSSIGLDGFGGIRSPRLRGRGPYPLVLPLSPRAKHAVIRWGRSRQHHRYPQPSSSRRHPSEPEKSMVHVCFARLQGFGFFQRASTSFLERKEELALLCSASRARALDTDPPCPPLCVLLVRHLVSGSSPATLCVGPLSGFRVSCRGSAN